MCEQGIWNTQVTLTEIHIAEKLEYSVDAMVIDLNLKIKILYFMLLMLLSLKIL